MIHFCWSALSKENFMRPIPCVSLAAAMSLLAATAFAATKPLPYHRGNVIVYGDQPPLTVNKRSWLDPGPVVPQGSQQNYVMESTGFNKTPDQEYSPSRFGGETLPRPLYPTGRPEPVATFWTPPYPASYPPAE
jgi:hypothetical protein